MTATNTAAAVLRLAAKEIGVREGRDSNGNWNNRVKYTTWYAAAVNNSAFLTSAWCAIFVSWVAMQAGVLRTAIPLHAWTPSGLTWFTLRGRMDRGRNAQVGDVFYILYPNLRRVAHTGFVEKVEGSYVTTIEGNTNTSGSSQGNGVYRLRRRITSNMFFCHPEYGTAPAPAPVKPAPAKPKPAPVKKVTVSLSGLRGAATRDPKEKTQKTSNWAAVSPVEAALVAEKLLDRRLADGHFGTATVSAYSAWQRRCGYTSKADTDGIPGHDSLVLLGKKYGFTVVK